VTSELDSKADIARRAFAAIAQGDFDAVGDLLDPQVKWHGGDPEAAGSCRNSGEALEFMRAARARGGIGQLVDVVEAGDKIVVIMRPPGEGEQLRANVTTFRDGKVVEMVAYESPDAALAAARA
jgi:ketosteroid isomerase-like protein